MNPVVKNNENQLFYPRAGREVGEAIEWNGTSPNENGDKIQQKINDKWMKLFSYMFVT